MKALVFNPTIPRFVATKALSAVVRSAVWGPLAPLQYRDIPEPPLPADDWVRVGVRLGGICGTDLQFIHLEASLSLTPLSSFPMVLGHENVGTIVEVGRAVTGLREGQRVTVEPVLPCAARGLVPPCANCEAGDYHLCLRFTDGHLSPGAMIGGCRDTSGSWSPAFVAHRSQVIPLPDGISDENALMVEPAAIAVHSFIRHRPPDRGNILVVGGGVIGQAAIAGLRAMGVRARIIALVKYAFQGEMAKRLGADAVVRLGRGDAHFEAIAEMTGARLLRPMLGPRLVVGGADYTVECVGSSRSLDDALRLTRSGGSVILIGLASVVKGVDWTPIWLKELHVVGSVYYAVEEWQGRQARTMDIVLDWMTNRKLDLAPLVSHRFPLSGYRNALKTAMGKAESKAFKVAFEPSTGRSRG